ncbi:hypothetical protein AMECASPLE_000470 [Ameca splendens]|uniref:Uncharacterized protein n=1 Tax=Ameca splendens TaxID=208324 RepID=A0ABV0Z8U7_9TELE
MRVWATTVRQRPGTPPTPHLNHGGAPACLSHSHSCTVYTAAPSRPAPPLKQSPAKTPLPEASATPSRGTRDRDPKNPNDPERAETPTPAPIDPQDLTPNPSLDPDQKARSFSQPPIPDDKQRTGLWKDLVPTFAHSNVVMLDPFWTHSALQGADSAMLRVLLSQRPVSQRFEPLDSTKPPSQMTLPGDEGNEKSSTSKDLSMAKLPASLLTLHVSIFQIKLATTFPCPPDHNPA